MIYQVIDDQGQQLDARYEAGEGYIALLSRGGSKKNNTARNSDYSEGLKHILNRIQKSGLSISDVFVDSSRVQHLSLDERRILFPKETKKDLKSMPPDLTKGGGCFGEASIANRQ